MGWFSPVTKKALRCSPSPKTVASAVGFLLLLALLPVLLSFQSHVSGSTSAGPRKGLHPPKKKGFDAEQLFPAAPLSGLDVRRNDTNDGSCEILRRRYPPRPSRAGGNIMRKQYAVITYSDGLGAKREHYCKVRANHCAFAELDGKADCIDNRNLDMCVDSVSLQAFHLLHPASWAKINLMQHCCKHYEYLLLLDADLIVMDPSRYPLKRFIQEANKYNKDVTFTGTGVDNAPLNSGMVGLRCPSSKQSPRTGDHGKIGEEFLRQTLQTSTSMAWRMHGLWEQRTMTKLFLENQRFRDGIFLMLPERHTQCYPKAGECSVADFSVHFLGDKTKYEAQFLRYFCQSRVSSRTTDDIHKKVCSRR